MVGTQGYLKGSFKENEILRASGTFIVWAGELMHQIQWNEISSDFLSVCLLVSMYDMCQESHGTI